MFSGKGIKRKNQVKLVKSSNLIDILLTRFQYESLKAGYVYHINIGKGKEKEKVSLNILYHFMWK